MRTTYNKRVNSIIDVLNMKTDEWMSVAKIQKLAKVKPYGIGRDIERIMELNPKAKIERTRKGMKFIYRATGKIHNYFPVGTKPSTFLPRTKPSIFLPKTATAEVPKEKITTEETDKEIITEFLEGLKKARKAETREFVDSITVSIDSVFVATMRVAYLLEKLLEEFKIDFTGGGNGKDSRDPGRPKTVLEDNPDRHRGEDQDPYASAICGDESGRLPGFESI